MIHLYKNIDCLITNKGLLATQGRRPQAKDLGIITKGAVAYSAKQGIVWVGKSRSIPRQMQKTAKHYNCKGLTAYPGFTDPHTHPVFSSNRAKEFSLRLSGATYQEIAAAGGGILSSIKGTRKASLDQLTDLVLQRLKIFHQFGVRQLEAKSGYGLSLAAEIKSLQAIHNASKKFKKIRVHSTCLAAHAIPPEYKTKREQYIRLICEKILPRVKKLQLATFVDVFCDIGFYTPQETRLIFQAAKKLGFALRLHGDELANTESACLAVEFQAHSVDHLLKISHTGVNALAKSNTVATLLPGTAFYLKEPYAPARKLIDSGAIVALASDFNPGSCTTQNLPFICNLAAIQMGMTAPEIVAAITYNASQALGNQESYGALLPGYKGEPVFCAGDDPAAIFYHLAPAKLRTLAPEKL